MRARPRDLVLLLVVAVAFYAFLIGLGGVSLLGDRRWAVKGLGLGVLLLPLVGIAIVGNELRFGRAAERLARLLNEPDGADETQPDETWPDETWPDETWPAGTQPACVQPPDPDAAFELRKAEVEAAPGDWRAWYRLAMAYGDARDPARARRTMRKAIALQRAAEQPRATTPAA